MGQVSESGVGLPSVLDEMLVSGYTLGRDGSRVPVHSGIGRPHAEALYRLAVEHEPAVAIEVGMALGFSTLALLGGGGEVVSVDPNQLDPDDYDGTGVHAIERAGFADRHRLIAKPSYLGLPQLLAEGVRCQFGYIDGWHTFDYTLLDFFYVDKMLDVGGVVGFNDCYLDSVHKVVKFVEIHRSYDEIDVGLGRVFSKQRNPLKALALRVRDHQAQDRYFRKVSSREPASDWFAPF